MDGEMDGEIEEKRQPFVGGQPETAEPAAGYLVRDGVIWCSGSLVEPDLVLTAGHCVTDQDERIEFGVGDVSAKRTVRTIARAVHPRYIEPRRNGGFVFQGFDVALLRLERAIDVPPVRIGASPRSGRVHAIGYGATSYVERPDGKVEPRGIGTERRAAEGFVVGVNPTEMFVRFELGSSACYGDSGSPLFDEDGRIVGVLSRFTGMTRCEPRMGSLLGYTRIDQMSDFFAAAKECLETEDVAGCLREDERRLCDTPHFSNRAARGPLIPAHGPAHGPARGDDARGVARFDLDTHAERSFSVTPQEDVVLTSSAKGDAAMLLFEDGALIASRTRRVELARGKSYELVVRSCNGTKQAVMLAWRPLHPAPR